MNQELFLRRATKVHVPVGSGGATRAQVASAIQEIAAFHCILSESVIERIGMLSADELARWLRDMLGVLRRRVGAHVQHQPFYPGFPEQVLKASKAELYLTAVMHYLTLRRLPAHEHARPPLLEGKLVPWLVELGSVAEFELLAPLVSSRTSLSGWTPPMSPGSSGSTVAMSSACCPGRAVPRDPRAGWRRAGPARGGRCAGGRIPGSQRRDRDRRAAAGGGPERRGCVADHGDDTLRADEARRAPPAAAPARSRTQRRGRRDAPRRTLEAPGRSAAPGDYADKYPRALAAITAARRDDAPASFGSRVETLLAQRHIATLTPLLQQRPGEFARRLDVTLRRSTDPDAVLDAFETVAAQASTPILLQVLAQTRAPRPCPCEPSRPRAHWPRSTASPIAASRSRPKCWRARPESAKTRSSSASRHCRRWAAASSTPLRDYIVPLAQRAASKSLRTLVRGSRLPLPDTRFIRLFLWWKNGRARTDIDLSAAFDANFVFMQTVAYYNLKGFGGYHSGDIVDAPQGASEFIDLDIDALVEKGIRYVVTSINSLHPAAVLRPARVLRRLDGPRRFGLGRSVRATHGGRPDRHRVGHADLPAFVMDLQERRVTWADLGLTSTPRWNNVRNNLSGVSLMLRALVHTPRPDLETLFDLHARARGERVKTRQEAQAVFAPHEGVTPFDVDKIRSAFL